MKFSTDERICRSADCPENAFGEALPAHVFAPRAAVVQLDAFHSFVPFSTCQLAYPCIALPFYS